MTQKQKTIFITGANRGLGLAFTRRFLQQGHEVFATCRNPDKANELRALQTQYQNLLHIDTLDILMGTEVQKQVLVLKNQEIDILILNAGVYGDRNVAIGHIDWDNLQHTFSSNAFAQLRLADALFENVVASNEKLIVAISSKMGSIADDAQGGCFAYRGSKAALNAMMYAFALDAQVHQVKVLLLHPGWVQTEMGGAAALIDADTSVQGMCEIIDNAEQYPSGSFLSYLGETVPW